MCYEAVINLKNSTNRQLGASLWIAIGLLLIMEELFINSETEYSFKSVYISGIFILIYGLLMFCLLYTSIHQYNMYTYPYN